MNKKLLAALIAATLGCGVATAQTNPNATTTNNVESSATTTPAVPSQAAKDAKDHSKAEYKARKKIADANKELNKADCETSTDGMAEHACKKGARAGAKQEKAEAKQVYETEKKQIKESDK